MASDRRIGRVGQAELDDAGAPPLGEFVGADRGQEAIDDERLDLNPGELHRARRADQLRAAAEQRERDPLRRAGGQQLLLGHAAALHELREARRRQALAAAQALLGQVGEGQVHVVAAQHQVVAHADAGELGRAAVGGGLDLHQREVGGAAAHVAHQHQPGRCQLGGEGGAVAEDPVLEGGLGFFDQA